MILMKRVLLFLIVLCVSITQLFSQQWGLYTLIAAQGSRSAYLVDTNGTTQHTWTLSSGNGYSAYMVPGGYLVRSISGGSMAGGIGGVQKLDYNGTVIWTYTISNAHHDICFMPNGNFLMIISDSKTATEVSAAGCSTSKALTSEKIIEVKPVLSNGTYTFQIVWEWKMWDHLCQSASSSKSNYVSNVADHPELLNINYNVKNTDFLHCNGLDYNAYHDQVILSSHYWNEFYILDHSTTTAQAATHTGGNSGKGGDFLYRWGNPPAYGASGTANFKTVHDAHWVPQNVAGGKANYVGGFNNQGGTSSKSAADLVNPSYNGEYSYSWGSSGLYTPSTYDWRYSSNYSATNMGNHEQLPNGNTLMCIPGNAVIEVSPSGTVLWSYSTAPPQAHRYSECFAKGTQPATPTITQSGNTLTCSTTGESYQWFLNSYMVSGATGKTYNAKESGIYQVQVVNSNFCYSEISDKFRFTYVGGTVLPTSISVTPAISTINTGATTTMTATVDPSGATDKKVTWSSSNTAIATVDTNGIVTGVSSGTVTITATSVAASSVMGTALVTVNVPVYSQSITFEVGWNLISIYVNPSSNTIASVFGSNISNVKEVKTLDTFWSITNANSSYNTLTTMSSGVGYLVNCSSGFTLSISGTLTTATIPTIKTGWNLIGVPSSTALVISTALNTSIIDVVKDFDYFWKSGSALSNLSSLSSGKAYYVKGK